MAWATAELAAATAGMPSPPAAGSPGDEESGGYGFGHGRPELGEGDGAGHCSAAHFRRPARTAPAVRPGRDRNYWRALIFV